MNELEGFQTAEIDVINGGAYQNDMFDIRSFRNALKNVVDQEIAVREVEVFIYPNKTNAGNRFNFMTAFVAIQLGVVNPSYFSNVRLAGSSEIKNK